MRRFAPSRWLRITTCLLEDYPAKNSTIGANDLLTNCATKTSFPDVITEEALACLAGPLAEQLEGEAASHTPPHPVSRGRGERLSARCGRRYPKELWF